MDKMNDYADEGRFANAPPSDAQRPLGCKAYSAPALSELGSLGELTNYTVSVRV
jgi:hypothetical protein